MNRVTMILVLGISPVACVSPPKQGLIERADMGKRYIDFQFTDNSDGVRYLRSQLGDYTVLAFTQSLEGGDSLLLGPIGVDALHRMAFFLQLLGGPLSVHFASEKHQHTALLFGCESQQAGFRLFGLDEIQAVLDAFRRAHFGAQIDAHWFSHEPPSQVLEQRVLGECRKRNHVVVAVAMVALEESVGVAFSIPAEGARLPVRRRRHGERLAAKGEQDGR